MTGSAGADVAGADAAGAVAGGASCRFNSPRIPESEGRADGRGLSARVLLTAGEACSPMSAGAVGFGAMVNMTAPKSPQTSHRLQ